MREIRLSGSEGGGTGNSTGSPYPYPKNPAFSAYSRAWAAPSPPVPTEMPATCGRSGPCPRNPSPDRSLRVPGCVPTPERGTDHLAPWCARRTQRPPRAVRVREMFPHFPENRKKIRNGPFFLHDPAWLRRSTAGRSAARRSGRPPHPRPNLPKEREIFSSGDQPGPVGVPDFGKTENRNQGRWRGRAGDVVVGAGLRGCVRIVERAEKNSILRK